MLLLCLVPKSSMAEMLPSTDESGWAWFIPLQDGKTSVGVIMDEKISKRKKVNMEKKGDHTLLLRHYLQELKDNCPKIRELIGQGVLIEYSGGPKVRTASDFSYSGTSYAGLNYRIVGDAGGKFKTITKTLALIASPIL